MRYSWLDVLICLLAILLLLPLLCRMVGELFELIQILVEVYWS